MAVRGKISELFAVPEIRSQYDQVIALIKTYNAEIDKAQSIRSTFKDSEVPSVVIKGMTSLTNANKEYKAIVEEVSDRITKLNGHSRDLTDQLNIEAKTLKELAKANLDNAKAKEIEIKATLNGLKAKKSQETTSVQFEKAAKREAKAIADAANEFKQLSLAANEADLRYKNLAIAFGRNHPLALQAKEDANALRDKITQLNVDTKNYKDNVGNYSSAFTNYANTLRGLRGPVKILGESLGIGAQQADQLRIFFEHAAQAVSAFFKTKEAKAAAESKDTAAIVANTEATKANASATETASAATSNFTKILKFSGIALFIVGIVSLIGWLSSLGGETKRMNKAMEGLKGVTDETKESLKEYGDTISEIAEGALSDAKEAVQQMNDELGKTPTSLDKVSAAIQLLNTDLENQNKLFELNNGGRNLIEAFGNLISLGQVARNNTIKTKITIAELELEFKKLQRAIGDVRYNAGQVFDLEKLKQDADYQILLNKRILDDDKSTLDQRIAALKSNFEERKKIINATRDQEIINIPENDILRFKKMSIAQRKAYDEIRKAEAEFQDSVSDIIEKNNEKERKAALELFKFRQGLLIEEQKNIQKYATGNEKVKARQKQNELEAELIVGISQFELAQKNLTVSQIKLIEEKRDEDIKDLAIKRLTDIQVFASEERKAFEEEAEKQRKFLEEQEEKRVQAKINSLQKSLQNELDNIEITANEQVTAENNAYAKKLRAAGKNSKERERLEREHQAKLQEIQNTYAISALQVQLGIYHTLSEIVGLPAEEADKVKKKIAEINAELSKLQAQPPIDIKTSSLDELITKFEKVKQYIFQIADVIGGAFEAAAAKQKNLIQDQIDLLEQQKQKDIEVAEQTITNQQDRAAAISVIESRAAAQREQLERRQRQIDERTARYKKAATIAQIILDTAGAVMKTYQQSGFFGGLAGAIAVGALGAAQLAVAIATPIPKYKEGKNLKELNRTQKDKYEGPAIVGDGNKRELIVRENGKVEVTDNKPQLTFLKSKDIVIPDAQRALNYFPGKEMLDAVMITQQRQQKRILAQSHISVPVFDTSELRKEIKGMRRDVVEAIKSKPVLQMSATDKGMTNIWQHSANRIKYINDQTNWHESR